MTGKFLDKAYTAKDADGVRALYDDWAASYEAEIAENGYATPGRCAAALARHAPDRAAPVLDIGCGTGLSGLALRAAGFTAIDGTDLSPEMLARAGEKAGLYGRLVLGNLYEPLPVAEGAYAHMVACGVIGPSVAPPATVANVLAKLPRGGCFAYSLNDHALADAAFMAGIAAIHEGAEVLEAEDGPHLPGIGLRSTVFVIRRP